jgi:5-methylcytosine-specific restriction endonuclease McrA
MIEERCPFCKGVLSFTKTDNLTHYGRLDCLHCNKWIKWVRNPETKERTREKTSKINIQAILKYHNYKEEFCFFCLRKKEQLGEKETLTIDHILEINKDGNDEIENLQILCSACHKLKNWSRLYLNWHLKREKEDDTATTSKP